MRDDCRLMAAAISFYALLSLVPLLLVGLSTFGYVLGNDRAFDAVYAFLIQLLPQDLAATLLPEEVAGAGLRSYLKKTLVKPAGVAGIVGVVSWIWAGT
ncbi:MAG TPA: YhjD/YihY/BrkB family envelope integrity protein, partial [Armatimonadota bacterium]|nr:YhjD/YihY/BrkB family envelope integrity protein [Armatimonadota bacterium]